MSEEYDELFSDKSDEEQEVMVKNALGVKDLPLPNKSDSDSDSDSSVEFDIKEYRIKGKKRLSGDISKQHKVKEKPVRKKREMTAERKAQLLENLKKGRETAKINRQKRAEYKKILKQNEKKKIDDVLIKDYEIRNNKKSKEDENVRLQKEIEELKMKIDFINNKPKKENVSNIKEDVITNEKSVVSPPIPQKVFSSRLKKGSIWK